MGGREERKGDIRRADAGKGEEKGEKRGERGGQ